MIRIEKATLENVSISLKQGTAKLRFSTHEQQMLPDEVRDRLSLLERMENYVNLTLASDQGEVMLELSPCKVSMADIKIGPGRGVVSFTTAEMQKVWATRLYLHTLLQSEMETVTVVIVEQQPALFSDQLPVDSDQLPVEPTKADDWQPVEPGTIKGTDYELLRAARELMKHEDVTISNLQRHLRIAYPRAARLMGLLEQENDEGSDLRPEADQGERAATGSGDAGGKPEGRGSGAGVAG